MHKLVKDFEYLQITFYWIDGDLQKLSSSLPTVDHAKEWILNHYFDLYKGPDRRRSKIDRRILQKSDMSSNHNPFKYGRRITDKSITIDIDLASEKVQNLLMKPIQNPANHPNRVST